MDKRHGQIVRSSIDANGNSRAFLFQHDSAGSPLFLVGAFRINDHGRIVSVAADTTLNPFHAFLATPSDDDPAGPAQIQSTINAKPLAYPASLPKLPEGQRFGPFVSH